MFTLGRGPRFDDREKDRRLEREEERERKTEFCESCLPEKFSDANQKRKLCDTLRTTYERRTNKWHLVTNNCERNIDFHHWDRSLCTFFEQRIRVHCTECKQSTTREKGKEENRYRVYEPSSFRPKTFAQFCANTLQLHSSLAMLIHIHARTHWTLYIVLRSMYYVVLLLYCSCEREREKFRIPCYCKIASSTLHSVDFSSESVSLDSLSFFFLSLCLSLSSNPVFVKNFCSYFIHLYIYMVEPLKPKLFTDCLS